MPNHSPMKKMRQLALILILALALQACLFGGTALTPTPVSTATVQATQVPTSVPATAVPTLPPAPTATNPPAPTQPPAPTATVPPAATQIPVGPPEAVLIAQPGPGSRVTSPVRVTGMADPTFEQSLVITILLADGTPLVTTSTQIGSDVGQRGPYSADVAFSVSQEQQGFIQVYAVSAKDGGVTHLSSVGVSLLPSGSATINPAQQLPEQIIIQNLTNGATVSGGVARVEGVGRASFEQTLLIEVLDENGAVIASAPVIVAAPDLGQPGPFSADLPYSVAAPTAGRIQVRDVSPAHGGNSHLTSVEVNLEP